MTKILSVMLIAVCLVSCIPDKSPKQEVIEGLTRANTYCSEGVTSTTIPLDGTYQNKDESSAFIVVPNEGCKLPTLYCIYTYEFYRSGLSCTPIDLKTEN